MELAAVLRTGGVDADVHVKNMPGKRVKLIVHVRALPPGAHGFHIHSAGDLRGEGCAGACSHFHKGAAVGHGGPPSHGGERHTGDLGNLTRVGKFSYILSGVSTSDLVGRSIIVHADADDLGKGGHEDSLTTGHSGARIACGIFGRVSGCGATRKLRRRRTVA